MRLLLTAIGVGLVLSAASGTVSAESVTKSDCLISLIDEAQVPAQEQGLLTEVLAQDGQQVEAGQVIARIDDVLAKLQLDVAQRELEVAQKRAEDQVSVEYARAAAAVTSATTGESGKPTRGWSVRYRKRISNWPTCNGNSLIYKRTNRSSSWRSPSCKPR